MFTGIVDHCGLVKNVEKRGAAFRLEIETRFEAIQEGESICVDGACLTALSPVEKIFSCDLSEETLRRTTASTYRQGSAINVERALRLGDRLGGHFVTGHIDSTGLVQWREETADFIRLRIHGFNSELASYLIPKGSIAVNGVSLTLNEVSQDFFDVTLIPHTWQRTNLHALREGSAVNLEFDWMTKVILKDASSRRSLIEEAR